MSKTSSSTTRLETSTNAVFEAVRAAQSAGETVGLVPTMGALHEGHLSLVDASLAECDRTVVSIFVNPTQFGPSEDLAAYPRILDRDLELLEDRGCWLVFAPRVEDMYRTGHETYVEVGSIAAPFEGKRRPIHFRGVATIVLKLLQIVPADRAYFGQKDYQQSLVIKQMAADFNLPIDIRVCPIVREPDGLAMSSRNAYLSPAERKEACQLWQSLLLAEQLHADGETCVASIIEQMKGRLATSECIELEYIAFVVAGTVRAVTTIAGPTVVAIAARVGQARLIDNHTIG